MRFSPLLLLIFLIAVAGYAAPGHLDPTFSGDGKLLDQWSGYDFASSVVVQSDGKILVAGGADGAFGVARYNPDGSPDTTFGSGTGKVTTNIEPGFAVYSVALQPDGKIIAAGCICNFDFELVDYFAVVRYNSNGSLDPTFGGYGIVTTVIGQDFAGASSVVVQTNGRIVVGGFTLNNEGQFLFAIVRYHSNGSLDASFGAGGKVTTAIAGSSYLSSVIVQPDGKIVAAGSSNLAFALVRYNPNGSLDATFGNDGKVITVIRGADSATALTLQPDGRIIAAGTSYNNGSGEEEVALVRYNGDGSLDTTFDSDGMVTTPVGQGCRANSVALQADGRILTAGGPSYFVNNLDFILVRYNSDGSLDRTFGGGDAIATADFDNSHDRALGMALDTAGRAVIVGSSANSFAIARFRLGTLSAPSDFDGDGRSDPAVRSLRVIGVGQSQLYWHMLRSRDGYAAAQWGTYVIPGLEDRLVPADYDGDGKTDLAVFRNYQNQSQAEFWILNSATSTVARVAWGLAFYDQPAPADYDGDGKADVAIMRAASLAHEPSTTWWILQSRDGASVRSLDLGGLIFNYKPQPADYNGDGKADLAFSFGSLERLALARQESDGSVTTFGLGEFYSPAIGDYDGDGKADIAAVDVFADPEYHFPTFDWYWVRSSDGQRVNVHWGRYGDVAVPADYDGDGRVDPAIYRRGNPSQFWIFGSSSGIAVAPFGDTEMDAIYDIAR